MHNFDQLIERTSRSNTFGNDENWKNQRYFDFNKACDWHLMKYFLSNDDQHKIDFEGGKRAEVNISFGNLSFKEECMFAIWLHECTLHLLSFCNFQIGTNSIE